MDQRYEFDAATGNLKSRQDALRNRTELFEYDALQRLTLYAGKKVEYTPDGNIVRKGDAGEMVTVPMPLQETHRRRKPAYTADCRWDILLRTDPHG